MSAAGSCTLLRSTVTAALRLPARPVASRVGAARGAASLTRAYDGQNLNERIFVTGSCRRHSTTVADEANARPGIKPSGSEASSPKYEKSQLASITKGLFDIFATKNTKRALSAARLMQTCLNNIERKVWYTEALMTNEYLTRLLWLATNVWLVSRRLLREGNDGKKVQEMLFDELWRETTRQMRSINVETMMLQKYLKESQQYTFGTFCQYDHAYTLEDRKERLDALAGALWRGIYSRNSDLDEELVRKMAEHLDSELSDMFALDRDTFFEACFEFGLPPPGLSTESPKAGKSRETAAQASNTSMLVDPDLGDDGRGIWRSSLAESGKVYFWHTVTKEVTYDKPAGVEYVPTIMPIPENRSSAT